MERKRIIFDKMAVNCIGCNEMFTRQELGYECLSVPDKGVCRECSDTRQASDYHQKPTGYILSKVHTFTPEYSSWIDDLRKKCPKWDRLVASHDHILVYYTDENGQEKVYKTTPAPGRTCNCCF